MAHFNKHVTTGSRPARSLESKFYIIRHDVSKFGGCYTQVERLNMSGTNSEDTLEKALELYKIKAPKNSDFMFLHCWWLMKDPPKWADGQGRAKKTTPTKRSRAVGGLDPESDCVDMEAPSTRGGPERVGSTRAGRTFNRPMGNRIAKEGYKEGKSHDLAMRVQAAATKDMAAATWRKTELLQEQNVLMLFTTSDVQITDARAKEYLRLRRKEELEKLRRRLDEEALVAEARRKAMEGNSSRGRAQPSATGLAFDPSIGTSEDDEQWPEEENFGTNRSSIPTSSQAFRDSQVLGQQGMNWENDSQNPTHVDSEGRIDLNDLYCYGQEHYND